MSDHLPAAQITLLQGFYQQVSENPLGIAVQYESRTLTFSDLDKLSSIAADTIELQANHDNFTIGFYMHRTALAQKRLISNFSSQQT